jgi:serine/threonine-protein kinase
MGAVTGFDPYLGLAGLTALGAGFGAMITTARAFSLRRIGVRLSDALGSGWKQAALLADPRPREAKLAEAMAALAPREVTDGAHGPTVRRAVEDQAAIREIVFKLSPADRALLPDIQPTVDALVERVVALATSLHRLDADLPPGAIAELDARLGAAERMPGGSPEERERHIALLRRQRESLADLAERRTNLGAQLERASLMLQNIRLDLVKLRSSGVGAFADATNATQEARALSRDIGHVLDAAREVRKI